MKKNWIIILVIAIIIIGIIAGMAIWQKNTNKLKENNIVENEINKVSEEIIDECTDEYKELEEQAKLELEANSTEEKISPNCLLILKRYYKECEHAINEYLEIPKNLVNGNKEDLEDEYANWEVKQYSSTQIVLYKEFDSNCGQHYILRNVDGKIVVYLIGEDDEESVFEMTDISVDYLTESDKIEIENGIRVNGKENLKQLIEDFE